MANFRAALEGAHPSPHRRRRAPLVVLLALGAMLMQTVGVLAASFTQVNAPFVKANDFITGMPTCTNFGPWVQGPIGLLQDDSHFYVGDSCNGTMYRYPSTGGSTPDQVVANGLDGGMATGGGVYYGIALGLTAPRVQEFDANTLTPGPIVMTATNFLYDLAYNPQTGDLWASGRDGLYRITTPSTNPSATLVITPPSGHEFDGIALSPDYTTIWVADHGGGHVYSYDDTTYAQTHDLNPGSTCSGPDGMAIAPPNTLVGGLDVSNDVFVNCNGGTVAMLDPVQNTSTLVASGGTRGDFATVGADGFMYATQGDRVEQLVPGFFKPRFGARATGIMVQAPQLTTTKADTGFYSNPSGGQVETDAASANVLPPTVEAGVMNSTAATFSSPPGGEARAESTAGEISIVTGTGHTIKAWSLDAVADTTCSSSVAGYSSIGGISIDGSVTEPVKAQNVVITLGSVVVTLNEIDITGSAGTSQQTEVTSIHVQAPNLDVRLSVALASAAAC